MRNRDHDMLPEKGPVPYHTSAAGPRREDADRGHHLGQDDTTTELDPANPLGEAERDQGAPDDAPDELDDAGRPS